MGLEKRARIRIRRHEDILVIVRREEVFARAAATREDDEQQVERNQSRSALSTNAGQGFARATRAERCNQKETRQRDALPRVLVIEPSQTGSQGVRPTLVKGSSRQRVRHQVDGVDEQKEAETRARQFARDDYVDRHSLDGRTRKRKW